MSKHVYKNTEKAHAKSFTEFEKQILKTETVILKSKQKKF